MSPLMSLCPSGVSPLEEVSGSVLSVDPFPNIFPYKASASLSLSAFLFPPGTFLFWLLSFPPLSPFAPLPSILLIWLIPCIAKAPPSAEPPATVDALSNPKNLRNNFSACSKKPNATNP